MNDLLFWYLISMIVAAVGWGLLLVQGFFAARERDRLPEAVRYTRLGEMIAEEERRYREARQIAEQMAAEIAKARRFIEDGKHWQQWKQDNETLLRTLESERRQQQELQATLAQLSEAIDREKQTRDSIAQDAQSLRADLNVLRTQTEGVKDERDRANNALAESKRQQEEIQGRLANSIKSASEAEAKAAAAQATCAHLQEELQATSKRLDETQFKLAQTEIRHRELETECAGLLARKTEIEAQIVEAKKEFDRFRADEEKRRKDFENQANKIITELSSQRDRIVAEIEKDIEQAKKRGLAHGVTNSDTKLADRIVDVWKPAIPRESLKDPLPTRTERELLEDVNDYLTSHALRFHPRAINAFHTSLKIANDSPLLVLAGISGTGKSLLPKRYAEATGIHLLTVPVQPRWDSPQDLLGFFNHLQGKFLPTSLMRALLQMERYSKAKGRHWPEPDKDYHNRKDQMLLVLLDEMNLARIEYYFSDFLSVLENRRDIMDREDDTQRRKGEIVVDVGSTGKELNEFRMFVDRNVLFVGTMNEDESTQTLSDKVVDRANVIRFAAPRKFVNAATNENAPQPTKQHLTYEVWNKWIDDAERQALKSDQEKKVNSLVGRLSDALKSVGRPFGHRVNKSIYSYLKQYPYRTDEGLDWAISDQIEQRILPKLRGVDLSIREAGEAVKTVHRIVDQEIKDPELAQVIQRGGRDAHQPFLWLGVDRGIGEEE